MKKASESKVVKALAGEPVKTISKRQGKRLEMFEMVRTTRDEGKQVIGFNSRPFILCGLPVKRPGKGTRDYIRRNGRYTLTITGHREYGLPFGQDRLIPIWLATMAIHQKSRTITFRSAAQLLQTFGLTNDGRSYRRLVDGFLRVACSTIHFEQDISQGHRKGIEIANRSYISTMRLWFHKDPDQETLSEDEGFGNVIVLSEEFWQEIQAHPIPVDLNVVRAFSDSPAKLDFYCWLVWRCFSAAKPSAIPLESLKEQFGVSESRRIQNFCQQVRQWLEATKVLWPECPARLSVDGSALVVSRGRAISEK